MKKRPLKTFEHYKINTSTIFGGAGGSTIDGELDMSTNIGNGGVVNAAVGGGGVLNAAIGKGNEANTRIGSVL